MRIIAICCLVASGSSAIFIAGHVGSRTVKFAQAHDLLQYSTTAFFIFALFYVEERLLRQFMSRPLDVRLAYWQYCGSLACTLAGAWNIVAPFGLTDFSGRMLWATAMVGEAVLVLNLVRSYSQDEDAAAPAPQLSRIAARSAGDDFGWPKSPAKLFAIGAGVLAGGGVLSMVFNFPAMKLPVPFAGQVHLLPFGCLWIVTATPFMIYARLYKRLTDTYRIEFDQSLNRVHFLVTIVAVVILIKDFAAWQQTLVSQMAALYASPDLQWLAAPFILSVIVFMLNVYRSFPPAAKRAVAQAKVGKRRT